MRYIQRPYGAYDACCTGDSLRFEFRRPDLWPDFSGPFRPDEHPDYNAALTVVGPSSLRSFLPCRGFGTTGPWCGGTSRRRVCTYQLAMLFYMVTCMVVTKIFGWPYSWWMDTGEYLIYTYIVHRCRSCVSFKILCFPPCCLPCSCGRSCRWSMNPLIGSSLLIQPIFKKHGRTWIYYFVLTSWWAKPS